MYTIEDFTSLSYTVVDGVKKIETVETIYENIKPYMTEKGHQRIVGHRFPAFLSNFAKNRQANISVDSVDLRVESKRDNLMESIKFSDTYDNAYVTDVLHSVVHTSENDIYKQIKSYIPRMYFAVTNTTHEKIELNFSTQQQFNVKLYQKSNEVFNYETSPSFGDEPTAITLDPGKHLVCYLPYPKDIKPSIYEYTFEILDEHFSSIESLKGIITIRDGTTN